MISTLFVYGTYNNKIYPISVDSIVVCDYVSSYMLYESKEYL